MAAILLDTRAAWTCEDDTPCAIASRGPRDGRVCGRLCRYRQAEPGSLSHSDHCTDRGTAGRGGARHLESLRRESGGLAALCLALFRRLAPSIPARHLLDLYPAAAAFRGDTVRRTGGNQRAAHRLLALPASGLQIVRPVAGLPDRPGLWSLALFRGSSAPV